MTRRKLFAGLDKLEEAEAEVTLAKARLGGTIDGIKMRLKPANILEEAIGGARTKSSELAESAAGLVRRRPATVAAGVIGAALFAARKPIRRVAGRLFSKR